MGEYYNDFDDGWEGQSVALPLHEVVRLYVEEAKMQSREETAKAESDAEHARKLWLDELNKRENAEAERDMLAARVRELEGGGQ